MTRLALAALLGSCLLPAFPTLTPGAGAATYYVDGSDPRASDDGAGSEAVPWQTIARAGKAAELKPGETRVLEYQGTRASRGRAPPPRTPACCGGCLKGRCWPQGRRKLGPTSVGPTGWRCAGPAPT